MARTSVVGSVYASFFVLFGCTYCGTEPPAAGERAPTRVPNAVTARDAASSPCGADAALNSNNVCVPNAWHCGPRYYNGGPQDGCDCDCGAVDPDCAHDGVEHWCYNVGRALRVDTCAQCAS